MKKYLLFVFFVMAGCQHDEYVSAKKKQIYYSSPELTGMVFFNDVPVANAQVYLLTICGDKLAVTDSMGYFVIAPACRELIPFVPETDLGFFYQVVVASDNQQYLWQVGGLGYGFEGANVEFDLGVKKVSYQVVKGVSVPYSRQDDLQVFNQQE